MNFEVGFYILCGVCVCLVGALVYFIWSKHVSDSKFKEACNLCHQYVETIDELRKVISELRRK